MAWLPWNLRHARASLLAVLAVGLAPSTGAAFTLKTLVMPGKVIQAHAQIEEHCERCHETKPALKRCEYGRYAGAYVARISWAESYSLWKGL